MAVPIRPFHPPHEVRKNPKAMDSDVRKALIFAVVLMAAFFLWSMSGSRNVEQPAPPVRVEPVPVAPAVE